MTEQLGNTLVKNPRQASEIFSLDGDNAVRPKNLFYIKFTRPSGGGDSSWAKGISFDVKSVDRPSINLTTKELNQYNKKRQIYTGYEVSPVKVVLYDTANSAAMRMWTEYAQHYFGDFRQDSAMWRDDILSNERMLDNDQGFGYNMTSNQPDAQFFFEKASIFQVFGQHYVQFDLINPRITQFDPDDLDYENSSAATISITLTYEAIVYQNSGNPMKISGSDASEAFSGYFEGKHYDVTGSQHAVWGSGSTVTAGSSASVDGMVSQVSQVYSTTSSSMSVLNGATTSGALSTFGNYSFGSATNSMVSVGALTSAVSSFAAGNTQNAIYQVVGAVLGPTMASGGINGAVATAATTMIMSNVNGGNSALAQQYAMDRLLTGVMTSGTSVSTTSGITLSSQAYRAVNTVSSPSYSQIGYNTGATATTYSSGTTVVWNSGASTTGSNIQWY